MKKTLILFLFVIFFYVYMSSVVIKSVTIPDDAIRIRVVPNSNSDYDQKVKMDVKNDLEKTMYSLLKDAKNSSEAKEIIESNLSDVDSEVASLLSEKNYNKGYDVNFGLNYFPEKEYKGVKYNAGYYESLLVTLGAGEGDNWWCVLFPPLCLIEGEENDTVEYKSIVKEIIDRYL